MQKIQLAILVAIAVFFGFYAFTPQESFKGAISTNNYDTTSAAWTHATTTVNTTSTQVFSSVARLSEIVNDTTGKITCSLDAQGTTAVSSTVSAGRGVIIVPVASSTSNHLNIARFGECRGEQNCYPHKGAVNCLSTAAVTVDKNVQ